MNNPHVLVIGASTIDTKGRAREPLVPATSNPGHIRVSAGGVARNVAENLGRLGVHVTFLSAVGDDEAGRHILDTAQQGGVDTGQVIVSSDYHSAAYLAVLDETGALATSIDDMDIMQAITPGYIYARRGLFRDADMVVLDANLSPPALRSALSAARKYDVPVCADPTSTHLAPRLRPHLADLYMITPNVPEAEVLCGETISDRTQATHAAKKLVSLGVGMAVITLAEKGLCYATAETSGYIPAIPSEVVDYTGAGDALTAAIVFGLLNDFAVDEAVRLGVSAATLTLRCEETVCTDLSLERLYDQLVI